METQLNITKQTLSTGWRVREVPRAGIAVHNRLPWLPAQVPGGVHLDLMRAGVIPDPLARLYEYGVAWVDEGDWVYETTFSVDGPTPACAYLHFHGLDTLAEIALNGEALGRTEDMFIPHEFPVGGKLKAGENTLSVTFRSALRVGRERQAVWNEGGNDTLPYHWDNWAERAFVRKAQYQYGWDWGPVLRGCGLWRPVELVTVPVARLGEWKHAAEFREDGQATLTVTSEVERAPGQEETPLTLSVSLEGANPITLPVPTGAGSVGVSGTVTVAAPRRWQPNGYGEAALYDLTLAIVGGDGDEVDRRESKVGLRTVELLHEPDADGKGEGFKFRVNGVDVYAKGANWIPDHSFPSLITPSRLRERIGQARDAGMTMLRIWGGGFYETEDFYDLCDEMGLLVWQDFPYGCSYYPDTGEYAELARRSRPRPPCGASAIMPRLPCGAATTRTIPCSRATGRGRGPRACSANICTTRSCPPWWRPRTRRPPTGPARPTAAPQATPTAPTSATATTGTSGTGAATGCITWRTTAGSAPSSASPPPAGWRPGIESLAVRRPIARTRPSSAGTTRRAKGTTPTSATSPCTSPKRRRLEDLVYYSQINQAEALKCGVEHYRRRKGPLLGDPVLAAQRLLAGPVLVGH